MNKLIKLMILICCFVLNTQGMNKLSRDELKQLILKSIPYSASISKDETQDSISYGTRLFFLKAYLSCKGYRNGLDHDSCSITDLDSGETIKVFDLEARSYLNALYAQRIQLAGLSEYELEKRAKSFKKCQKLLRAILQVEHILKEQNNDEQTIKIVSPRELLCRKKRLKNGEIYTSCSQARKKILGVHICEKLDMDCAILEHESKFCDFEGSACWEILEERLAELEKEEAELK